MKSDGYEIQLRLPGIVETDCVPTSWVYLGMRGGFAKVGVSRDVARRAAQLHLVILRTWPGDRSTEKSLHRLLRPWRQDREWYVPDVVAVLLQIPDLAVFL
jgi:hypothetical protein